MNFTDIFIKRPVLATVVSILILVFGLRAISELPLRQFPAVESAIINISTIYPGANAELMQSFITNKVQRAVAAADGIDFIASSSRSGLSNVKAYVDSSYNTQDAFTDIMSRVSAISGQLPDQSERPVISKSEESGTDLIYLSFYSDIMSQQQITDYIERVVQPQLETIVGVAKADILGAQIFSLRIWLDPLKMATHNVTPTDIMTALQKNNIQATAGRSRGLHNSINISADTQIKDLQSFKNLTIFNAIDSNDVKLQDVAEVELGAENYDAIFTFNGEKAVAVSLAGAPSANPLNVIQNVYKQFSDIQKSLPAGLNAEIAYDATNFIRDSIKEVNKTIIEAAIIVIIVIFLFLGSLRSVLIPVIAIPLALIGVCTFMLWLGYSINTLTLLAMVLAIGIVVDDAIVVLENIHRHIEEGKKPLDAALIGAREIALPVVTMTLTLAAVYAPISFMGGITGALFKEFAFTLAFSVIISGVVALTLSPVMCAKFLQSSGNESNFTKKLDAIFKKLQNYYQKRLKESLQDRRVTVYLAILVSITLPFFYMFAQKETAPKEDIGFIMVSSSSHGSASLDYTNKYSEQLEAIYDNIDDLQSKFISTGPNSIFSGLILKPWEQRQQNIYEIQQYLNDSLKDIVGVRNNVIIPSILPGAGGGPPFQMVITTIDKHESLVEYLDKIQEKARESGLFIFIGSNLAFDDPEVMLNIDRDKAAALGVSMQEIISTLGASLAESSAGDFNINNRNYKIILQLAKKYIINPEQLAKLHIRTRSGDLIPLSTITTMEKITKTSSLDQFQQLNSATISGLIMPPNSMGQAVNVMEQIAQEILPAGFSYDFIGQSRQFKQEGNALLYAFFFSILIIFLVLSAQYNSFRDPFIILISVPLSLCGALIPLFLGLSSINIYTQIGMITLIGLISKHGILMVDFANKLQISKSYDVKKAITEAAAIRLRPILMTTAAIVFAVIPLMLASGAGAASRFSIGIVIAFGMIIGTLFTLFVVPTFYTLIAKQHKGA